MISNITSIARANRSKASIRSRIILRGATSGPSLCKTEKWAQEEWVANLFVLLRTSCGQATPAPAAETKLTADRKQLAQFDWRGPGRAHASQVPPLWQDSNATKKGPTRPAATAAPQISPLSPFLSFSVFLVLQLPPPPIYSPASVSLPARERTSTATSIERAVAISSISTNDTHNQLK